MTRIDEIISNALAGIEETEVAILARELLKTREALALAQQAKGCAEGRAALADRRALGMKPHVFAAMVNSVRDLARQYGHMEQFRCRIADLLGKYIHVEHNSKGMPEQTEAQAVVVPEPGEFDLREIIKAAGDDDSPGVDNCVAEASVAWVRKSLRAIPADRVLGDGMIQVDPREWNLMQAVRSAADQVIQWSGEGLPCGETIYSRDARSQLVSAIKSLDALRANQGGLNHVHV